MEPTSGWLIVVLLAGSAALLWLVARGRHWAARTVAAAGAVAMAMTLGMAEVNDHYGYYRSWSALEADMRGTAPAGLVAAAGTERSARYSTEAGTVRTVQLPGPLSRINRSGLVYLPPQYFQARYQRMRFPLVELLHGSPGQPSDWVQALRLTQVVNTLLTRHLMGPMVIVMPAINAGHRYQECVNTRAALDDTYIAQDVPHDIRARLRVSLDPAQLGISGYSSGGYCAANLALRHRALFGAAAVMDGYFRAQDGPAAAALGHNAAALRANSPLLLAEHLSLDTQPVPAFWVSAGTGAHADYVSAQAFAAVMQRVEQVDFGTEPGAGHNFYAWSAALPSALAWFWQRLATPDQRTEFPTAGSASSVDLPPVLIPRTSPAARRP